MRRGERLLLAGDYDGAVEHLSRAAKGDTDDYFNVGPICFLGVAYLLAGRYSRARKHFQDVITRTKYRVSIHSIYLGMAEWFAKKEGHAIVTWKEALRSQYSSEGNLDVPFVLFFASCHRPELFPTSEVRSLITARVERVFPDDFPQLIAEFLLNRIDTDNFRKKMDRVAGKNVPGRRKRQIALADFYVGLSRLSEGDAEGYLAGIQSCAYAKGFPQIFHEYVLARLELRRMTRRRIRRA